MVWVRFLPGTPESQKMKTRDEIAETVKANLAYVDKVTKSREFLEKLGIPFIFGKVDEIKLAAMLQDEATMNEFISRLKLKAFW